MSLSRAPYNSYSNSNNNHNNSNGMAMSTSKSEFFRVVRNRLMEEFEGPADTRHHSSESLLADSSSVSLESSLDYFINQDHNNLDEDEDEDIVTPTPTTPEVSSRKAAVSSLDSLLDNESSVGGMSMQSQQLTMSSRAKSNSLPKSAFGSLQLKVQEIRAQLDVLKTSSDVRRVLQQVCPPPRPQGQDNTQHPNTPAHGFEYMMPPNVVQEQNNSTSSWSNYFPVFPTSAIDASGCSSNPDNRRPLFPSLHSQHHQQQQQQHHHPHQQQQQHPMSMFQSPPSSSQDTDSVSPLSLSPSRTSSPATAQPATLSASMAPSHNNTAAGLALMGTSGSSSPSTLSASSTNSLPTSVSRPSVLKIPHSQSLNSFPYNINNNNNLNNNNCNNNLKNYSKGYFDDDAAVSQVGRLFFFYDVLSTQEKISKVKRVNL